MLRPSKLLLIVIVISLGAHCERSTAADTNTAIAPNSARQIYEAFLDGWTAPDHAPINVSSVAAQPRPEDLAKFTECAKAEGSKPFHWTTSTTASDLPDVAHDLSYVRLVDPAKWKADDPQNRMAKGQSVPSAVDAGMAHGILTVTTIAFDDSGTTAAFVYSFVCGGLCGNGGVVVFTKSSKGWVRSKVSCGGWIS